MTHAFLEHVNITVSDPEATARILCDLFGWRIRWSGKAKESGVTFHVGEEDTYLALYSRGVSNSMGNSYETPGALNHLGVVVEDLDAAEARVVAAGYRPHLHADYDPGRRFYFDGPDGIEIEVVSYA